MLSLHAVPSPLADPSAAAMRSVACEGHVDPRAERRGSHRGRKPFILQGYWLSSEQGNLIPATV